MKKLFVILTLIVMGCSQSVDNKELEYSKDLTSSQLKALKDFRENQLPLVKKIDEFVDQYEKLEKENIILKDSIETLLKIIEGDTLDSNVVIS